MRLCNDVRVHVHVRLSAVRFAFVLINDALIRVFRTERAVSHVFHGRESSKSNRATKPLDLVKQRPFFLCPFYW